MRRAACRCRKYSVHECTISMWCYASVPVCRTQTKTRPTRRSLCKSRGVMPIPSAHPHVSVRQPWTVPPHFHNQWSAVIQEMIPLVQQQVMSSIACVDIQSACLTFCGSCCLSQTTKLSAAFKNSPLSLAVACCYCNSC